MIMLGPSAKVLVSFVAGAFLATLSSSFDDHLGPYKAELLENWVAGGLPLSGLRTDERSFDKREPSLWKLESAWDEEPVTPGKVTVMIRTFDRELYLKQTIDSLRQMEFARYIDTIGVQWVNTSAPLPEWLQGYRSDAEIRTDGIRIIIEQMEDRSLNKRFHPFSWIRTHAVISLDDDLHFESIDLQRMFNAFASFAPNGERLVGAAARHFFRSPEGDYFYNLDGKTEYSIILTGVSIMHRSHLALYWQDRYAPLRELVAQNNNCEDIAMNTIVANWTSLPNLLVRPKCVYMHPSTNSLSAQGSHFEKRNGCVRTFMKMMNDRALITTSEVLTTFDSLDFNSGAHCFDEAPAKLKRRH